MTPLLVDRVHEGGAKVPRQVEKGSISTKPDFFTGFQPHIVVKFVFVSCYHFFTRSIYDAEGINESDCDH